MDRWFGEAPRPDRPGSSGMWNPLTGSADPRNRGNEFAELRRIPMRNREPDSVVLGQGIAFKVQSSPRGLSLAVPPTSRGLFFFLHIFLVGLREWRNTPAKALG